MTVNPTPTGGTAPDLRPLLINLAGACRFLAASEKHIRRAVHNRELVAIRLGKQKGLRFRLSDLERYAESRAQLLPAPASQAS